MSGNRPDLHTPQHDQWDQGGHCNNLVLDDDGCGTVCGYSAPSDYTPTTRRVEDRYWLATVNDEGVRLRAGEEEARAEFRAWLAEHDAKVRAEAWDEGFGAGWEECDDPDAFVNDVWDAKTPNPYRGSD